MEDALQAWLGVRVLPLGRHSIMNGVAGRVTADATGGADSFLQSLNALNLSWSRLSQWADAETRRLAARGGFVEEDVPLSVWQRTFATSVAASGDAYERLLQIKIPAGVLAP
ncbi:hypothetical protein HJG43_02595 [Kineosporiaceae bacterium SCSIO 59966]|nr:hypothetical protein HJG43_02595 [Kineosporiaceae bacterium SCSIO 59966]